MTKSNKLHPARLHSKTKTRLSWIEKFSIATGVMGLIADVVALTTFFLGLWDPSASGSPVTTHGLFIIVSGLFIAYGWITVAWTLARTGLGRITDEHFRRTRVEDCVEHSVVGVGLLLAPVAVVWIVAAFRPVCSTATEIVASVIPAFLLGYPTLGGLIYGSVRLLMPLCYDDLAERRVGVLIPPISHLLRPPPAVLAILQGANAGKQFSLVAQLIIVGRDPPFCDFPLYDPYVNNPHFSVRMKEGKFYIIAEESTNGTRVNGASIPPHEPVLLQEGAIIEVGQTRLQFRQPGNIMQKGSG